jgi:alkylation response protein AidB-like acyl-CoA dehydrogenase
LQQKVPSLKSWRSTVQWSVPIARHLAEKGGVDAGGGYLTRRQNNEIHCLADSCGRIVAIALTPGDIYAINGVKHWITGASVSKLHLIFAQVYGERGEHLGIGGFLTVRGEAEGMEMTKRENTLGLRGMPEGELTFTNLVVPAGMALLPPSGFKRGFADLINAYNSQRVGAGTVAMGIAAGAFEHARDWLKTREQFGRPIGEFQGLQWMLADMQTQLTASRLMLHMAARSRGPGGSPFPDPELAAQAKIFASEAALKIVSDSLQMFGARGYSEDLPLERIYRDVRMFTIGGGTAQVLRTLVASKVLGWKLPQTRDSDWSVNETKRKAALAAE